ncbi:MAG: hypothetical protein JO154_06910 [Chitinophaga sp.]|uniref:hypothetical protein n=1 Tax=Chitinophaga sp. TaxID=1869181 RepID=UPI0025BAE474|nr:hypothetical protein [Chitinophaga sp.]MBV8252321.1 hypothetical protein [Chitinophaga sp.]
MGKRNFQYPNSEFDNKDYKVKPSEVIAAFSKEGIIITEEEAQKVLELMHDLAELSADNIMKKLSDKNTKRE